VGTTRHRAYYQSPSKDGPTITTTSSSQTTMRAITQSRYGTSDVLRLTDVARPSVGPNEVLVRVHAAGLDRGTEHLMTGKPYAMRLALGLRGPKNPVSGRDVAGTVAEVGSSVTRFAKGDEVYGVAPGSFAEYAIAKEDKLARKPASCRDASHPPAQSTSEGKDFGALVPISAATALQAVHDIAKPRPGQSVLVLGASGGVGTYAVQLAKALDAEVTGVSSTAKLVRSHWWLVTNSWEQERGGG
jgi:NADPH:quinone reductase-like Zn-dependent oxidoreductase